MKQTKILNLLGMALPSATAGYLVSKAISANGGAVPVTPLNIILALATVSAVLLILALPVFNYRRALIALKKNQTAQRVKRPNPFHAARLVILAKATAIVGALFFGWHAGVIWAQLSLPVTTGSVWQNVMALVTSAAMVASSLIVESFCRVPDDSDDDATSARFAGQTDGKVAGQVSRVIEKQ